jgi:CheY-like chemotaxis protein
VALILVVDDEENNRELLRAVLSSEGHEVRLAADGRAALDELEGCSPALVIVDLSMPVVNGTDLIRQIRREPRHAATPIALYTGTEVDAMIRDFMQIHAGRSIVPKPAGPEEILVAIRSALRWEEPDEG